MTAHRTAQRRQVASRVAVGQVVSRYAVCEPTSFIAGNEHIASQVIFAKMTTPID
jgi:hypothetical protein